MALAAALLLGPLAWALDQGASYALVKWVCASGAKNLLTALGVVALGMTVAGLLCGWSTVAALRGNPEGGQARDPRYFMGVVAIALNALIALLIIVASMPRYILNPCE